MSSRLYAWLREQTDEPLAEYLMSCLAPAPLSDLVTKDFLTAELASQLAGYATKDDLAALEARLEAKMAAGFGQVDQRFAQVDERFAKMDERFAQVDGRFEQVEAAGHKRHKWLIGMAVFLAVEIAAAEAGWLGRLFDLVSSPV